MVIGQPSIFRGDSFQILLSDSTCSLRAAILLGCQIRLAAKDRFDTDIPFPRLGVGIGEVAYKPSHGPVTSGQGTAFELSGRALDEAQRKHITLRLLTPWARVNRELDVECTISDNLLKRMSIDQCRALSEAIRGRTQADIASDFGVSQSAIQQRLAAAGAKALMTLVERFTEILAEEGTTG
ncbi:MAG: hypothetical protein KGY81_07600 [Phycisphaerae bacterium]|nr:hypothetical protein [Phycisphaerae bacterium]